MISENFSTERLSSSADTDDAGGSEKNTGSGDEASRPAIAQRDAPAGLSFSGPVCSFGSSRPDQRELGGTDKRELALDTYEPETCLHLSGIEDLGPVQSASESAAAARVSLQLETRGITSQKKEYFQRELWARQTMHKNTVATKLREVGRVDLAVGLEECHTEITWATCKGCNKSKKFLNRCERFYCAECQPTLSKDRERSVGWWVAEMQQPKHVVLTLKNFPILTKAIVKHAKKCFDRLRRRKFARNWLGGFYSWEVTKEIKGTYKRGHICEGGWHLHVHAMVEARWIDEIQLALEWAKVTEGQGRIVDVKDARNHDYLKEVTKYAVKGSQLACWSGDEISMFIDAFTGVRTFGVFGSLYGKRTKFKEWIMQLQARALKCDCGCEQFWYQSDFDYTHGELVPESMARPPTSLRNAMSQLQLMCV